MSKEALHVQGQCVDLGVLIAVLALYKLQIMG